MKILLHPYVNKFLEKLDKKISRSIKEHIEKLAATNSDIYNKELDIKKLKGRDKKPAPYRLRVGEYRIIFFIEKDEILVTDIFHRSRGYNLI